jgi:centromeric protein E
MKADLEAAHTERQRLQDQLVSTAKAGDGRVKEATETILALRAQLQDTEVQVGDVESRLQSEINNKTKMEMQLKAAVAERAEKDSSIKHIQGQLATRQKEFEVQQAQLANIKADLASRIAALATAEKTSMTTAEEKRQLSTKLVSIQEENTMHRSALAACQSQLEKSLADLAASNLVSKKLSEDLSIARATEAATRPRHASTPTNSHAGTGVLDSLRVQALRSATTGDGGLIQEKLKTKERNEIERLEKIIEAQKEVIDDQREKIKFWAKVSLDLHRGVLLQLTLQELEQQREIVRMLTLTQDGNATPTKNSPRATHAKSKSMSAANLESPGPGSSHARVHLPNSFTAKNLALPTTPTPLPMHPSQFSNTSNRRGRRITIDHDMDLLTGMSPCSKVERMTYRR